MSDTFIHKSEAKFRNGLIEVKEAPFNLIKKWDRYNFEVGYFRNMRNKKKYLLITSLLLLIGCNPCRQVAKHPECFRADTIKQVERVVHTEKEYIIKDSITYDTLPGKVIEKTIFQTKWKVKTDTIYRLEKTDRINPINQQLKQDNEKLIIKNKSLKSQRNKLAFSLSGLIILLAIIFIIKRYVLKI